MKTPSVKFCPECGRQCATIDHFCESCGHKFGTDSQSSPKPSPQLPSEDEGSLQHVTVLIVDMKSSTEMIGKMDPEQAKEILFPAIQKLSSIVYEYDGTVISTAGDGLLAIFGATKTLENHAMRACLASIAMHRQIKSINSSFVIRVGLNTGEIFITVKDAKYDVVGAVIHLAARMEHMANPGTTQLTRNTLKQVEGHVVVENLGTFPVKGFTDPIEIFELKDVKVTTSLNELEKQFKERTGFVNRDQEGKLMQSVIAQVKSGQGNTVAVCAETGIGKSRFIYEVINTQAAKDCNILFTAGFIHTKSIALLPIKNLISSIFGAPKPESQIEEIKQQITPFIEKINTPNALNAALNLINIPSNDPTWNSLDPNLKRKYLFEVGIKVLLNFSADKPLIIIVEDMHWVDSESELFLDALIPQISKFKICLIINFRPEYHDRWENKPNYKKIILTPLTTEACSTMLDNLLGTDPHLTEIKTRLLGTAEGNPFFLEELVLSLVNEKIFVGKPCEYHLREGTNVNEIRLPESIVGIYQSKIDNLRPIEKKILQLASVIGSKFLYTQLIQLMDVIDEGDVRAALNHLIDDQFIYESQLYPELGFAFQRSITLDISYNSLLKKTRKELQLKLFNILEATLDKNQSDQLQIVAEHAYLGENWEKAFCYFTEAADKVREINAFTTAALLYEKALIAATHLPETNELTYKVMQIHYALHYSYILTGRFKEQHVHLESGLAIALAKKDRLYESLFLSATAIHFMGYKNINEGLQHAINALQIAQDLKSKDALAIAQFSLINIYFFIGVFEKVIFFDQELEKTCGGDLDFRSQWLNLPICHLGRIYESWTRSITGDFATVDQRKEQWIAGSKNLEQPTIANACLFSALGMNSFLKGEWTSGIEYTTNALRYSLATELLVFVPVYLGLLSNMNLRLNKIAEGKAYLDKAIALVEKISAAYIAAPSMITISECLLLTGEYEKAKEFCDNAMKKSGDRQIASIYGLLQRISAEIDMKLPQPNYEEIKKKLEMSVQTATTMKMWTYAGRCHLSFAHFYHTNKDLPNRDIQLQSAIEIFERCKMTYWLEQAISLKNSQIP